MILSFSVTWLKIGDEKRLIQDRVIDLKWKTRGWNNLFLLNKTKQYVPLHALIVQQVEDKRQAIWKVNAKHSYLQSMDISYKIQQF